MDIVLTQLSIGIGHMYKRRNALQKRSNAAIESVILAVNVGFSEINEGTGLIGQPLHKDPLETTASAGQ